MNQDWEEQYRVVKLELEHTLHLLDEGYRLALRDGLHEMMYQEMVVMPVAYTGVALCSLSLAHYITDNWWLSVVAVWIGTILGCNIAYYTRKWVEGRHEKP